MFEREITLNLFMLDYLDRVVQDIPQQELTTRPAGGGHPPVWILGHLALAGELGVKFLGGPLKHPGWLRLFGPGSTDDVPDAASYSRDELHAEIHTTYGELRDLAVNTTDEQLAPPHGIELLDGTKLQTIGDLISHLLSTHLSFHVAQLSSFRRAAGQGPLF